MKLDEKLSELAAAIYRTVIRHPENNTFTRPWGDLGSRDRMRWVYQAGQVVDLVRGYLDCQPDIVPLKPRLAALRRFEEQDPYYPDEWREAEEAQWREAQAGGNGRSNSVENLNGLLRDAIRERDQSLADLHEAEAQLAEVSEEIERLRSALGAAGEILVAATDAVASIMAEDEGS